jgi:hypothetical protein
MHITGVYLQLLKHCPTKGILGQHAFNRMLDDSFRVLAAQLRQIR